MATIVPSGYGPVKALLSLQQDATVLKDLIGLIEHLLKHVAIYPK
jgi:hypothetical protein